MLVFPPPPWKVSALLFLLVGALSCSLERKLNPLYMHPASAFCLSSSPQPCHQKSFSCPPPAPAAAFFPSPSPVSPSARWPSSVSKRDGGRARSEAPNPRAALREVPSRLFSRATPARTPCAPSSSLILRTRRASQVAGFSSDRRGLAAVRGAGLRALRATVRDRRLPGRALDQLERLLEAKQYEVKLLIERHGSLLDPLALRQAYVHHTLNSKLTERMRIHGNLQERDAQIRAMHAARWQPKGQYTHGELAREAVGQAHDAPRKGLKADEKPTYDVHEVLQETEIPHRLSVACDLKRRSCTNLAADPRRLTYRDPGAIAVDCASAGADIILVNTNKEGWDGSYEDLKATTQALRSAYNWAERPAVVMKDIIIHPIQIAQAVEARADGVYLHFSVAGKDLEDLLFACTTMGTQALVEVHSEAEAQQAEDAGATLLVVNQWDRYTGRLFPEHALRVRSACSPEVVVLAAGGLFSTEEATKCAKSGFDGVVLGQALTRPGALDLIAEIKAWRGAPRELVHLFAPNPQAAAAAARGVEEAAAAIAAEEEALKAQRKARRAAGSTASSETETGRAGDLEDGAAHAGAASGPPRLGRAAAATGVNVAEGQRAGDANDEGELDLAEKVYQEAKRGWRLEGHDRLADSGDADPRPQSSTPRPRTEGSRAEGSRVEAAQARRDASQHVASSSSERLQESPRGGAASAPADRKRHRDEASAEEFSERVLRQSGPNFQPRHSVSLDTRLVRGKAVDASAQGADGCARTPPPAHSGRSGDVLSSPPRARTDGVNPGSTAASPISSRALAPPEAAPRASSETAFPPPPQGIVDVSADEQGEAPAQKTGPFHDLSTLHASASASERREHRKGLQKPGASPEAGEPSPDEEQLLRTFTHELLSQITREQQLKRLVHEEHRDQQLAMFRWNERLARVAPASDGPSEGAEGAGALLVPPLALREPLAEDPPGSTVAAGYADPLAAVAAEEDAHAVAEPFREAFPNDPARAAAACSAAAAAAIADPAGFAAVARAHLQKAAEGGAYTLADPNDPAAALSAAAPTQAAAAAAAAATAAIARGERDARAAAKAAAAALRGAAPPSPQALAAMAAAAVQARKEQGARPDQLAAPFAPPTAASLGSGEAQKLVVPGDERKLLGASLLPSVREGDGAEEAALSSGRRSGARAGPMGGLGESGEEPEVFDEAELERVGRLFFTEEELAGFLQELRDKKATKQALEEGAGSARAATQRPEQAPTSGLGGAMDQERAGDSGRAGHADAADPTPPKPRTGSEGNAVGRTSDAAGYHLSSPGSTGQGRRLSSAASQEGRHAVGATQELHEARRAPARSEGGAGTPPWTGAATVSQGARVSVEKGASDGPQSSEPGSEAKAPPSEGMHSASAPESPAHAWRAEKVSFSTEEWLARADRRKKEDQQLRQSTVDPRATQPPPDESDWLSKDMRTGAAPGGAAGLLQVSSPVSGVNTPPGSPAKPAAHAARDAPRFEDGGRETVSRFGTYTPGPSLVTPMDQLEAFLPYFQGRGSHHHLDDPPEVQERRQQQALLEELKLRGGDAAPNPATSAEDAENELLAALPRTGQHAYELLETQQRLHAQRRETPPPAAALSTEAVAAAARAAAAAVAEGASLQAASRAATRAAAAASSASSAQNSLPGDDAGRSDALRQTETAGGVGAESFAGSDAAAAAAAQGAMLGGERGAYAALLGSKGHGVAGFLEQYVDELARSGGLEVGNSDEAST
ncbi:indole-3-glycerol phosphate synthase domain-containing protein [Besnoitia besnoiti]|uniref:indole-3-glycerol-phosphate synthase n=1 Tax=Besnoitia besnoiti TaxID=94643 RepID=A0A2A9MM83_BESBE|nr:indole-3-glycerol phosphate synthase domain-containing protein [Besnoitia besnoiti]PFH36883.1 indole-3-glycerol phosphate synthase domain-containing protein [Besnoitia besnoiti]